MEQENNEIKLKEWQLVAVI